MASPQRVPINGARLSLARDAGSRPGTGGRAREDHASQRECSEAARVESRYAEVRRGIERILDAERDGGGQFAPEVLATLVGDYVRTVVAADPADVAHAVLARAVLWAILEYERSPVGGPPRRRARQARRVGWSASSMR